LSSLHQDQNFGQNPPIKDKKMQNLWLLFPKRLQGDMCQMKIFAYNISKKLLNEMTKNKVYKQI
jgi:hypothetical protein